MICGWGNIRGVKEVEHKQYGPEVIIRDLTTITLPYGCYGW